MVTSNVVHWDCCCYGGHWKTAERGQDVIIRVWDVVIAHSIQTWKRDRSHQAVLPTWDTESDPRWGWWGSGNETTFDLASVQISKRSVNRGFFCEFWRCQWVAVPTTVPKHFGKGGKRISTGILVVDTARYETRLGSNNHFVKELSADNFQLFPHS